MRYCVHPPEWSLCFPKFCGALALRSWLPSRPNALRVILPDARPSDCLGAPFYVIMSLCNLCGFYVLWSNGWFQYRCLPPLSSVVFTIICFIGGVTDVVVTRASRDSLLPCRCHCSVRVGVCFPVNGVEAPKSVSQLCFWSLVQGKWSWSTLTWRGPLNIPPLKLLSYECALLCHLSLIVQALVFTVAGTVLGPTVTVGMPAIGPGISQTLFSPGHQRRFPEVRS